MLIDLMSASFSFIFFNRIAGLVYSRSAVYDIIKQFIRLVYAFRDLAFNDLLAVESVHRNVGISSDDDAVSFSDLFSSKYVLGTAGTSGFDLDLIASGFGSLFDCFSSHIGVSDTGRAGCNSQDQMIACNVL